MLFYLFIKNVSCILALNSQLYYGTVGVNLHTSYNIMPLQTSVTLYSKDLYIVWDKTLAIGIGASNKKALVKRTGIKYGKLRYIFSTLGLTFYEDDKFIMMKIDTNMIFKREDKKEMRGSRKKI